MTCKHEAPPFPAETPVQRIADNPLPRPVAPGYESVVPCIHCGAPVNRGRYTGMTSVPDLWDEHTWPYGRDDD